MNQRLKPRRKTRKKNPLRRASLFLIDMGTNVYAIRKNPRTIPVWDKIEQAVDARDPWKLQEEMETFQKEFDENRIHIGKRSGGWKFIFDFQNWKYFDHTEESIKEFLGSCFAIEDEYGDYYDLETFWKDFAIWNPSGLDGKTYEESEGTPESRARARANDYYESTTSPAGPIPDNLPYRFSNHVDFG